VEGLHVVGGVTTVSKISICMCLNSIKMHVCDACNIIMYFVAMILLLIPLILYVSSNYMFTMLSLLTSFKCILHKYENVSA
jgi:hypothetical protein